MQRVTKSRHSPASLPCVARPHVFPGWQHCARRACEARCRPHGAAYRDGPRHALACPHQVSRPARRRDFTVATISLSSGSTTSSIAASSAYSVVVRRGGLAATTPPVSCVVPWSDASTVDMLCPSPVPSPPHRRGPSAWAPCWACGRRASAVSSWPLSQGWTYKSRANEVPCGLACPPQRMQASRCAAGESCGP